jgi:hypothetical protein
MPIAAEYAGVVDEEAASHDCCLNAFRMSIHYCPTGTQNFVTPIYLT